MKSTPSLQTGIFSATSYKLIWPHSQEQQGLVFSGRGGEDPSVQGYRHLRPPWNAAFMKSEV